jgi:hypothetical protein
MSKERRDIRDVAEALGAAEQKPGSDAQIYKY